MYNIFGSSYILYEQFIGPALTYEVRCLAQIFLNIMISEHYARKFCRDDLSLIENYALAIADTA